MEWQIRERGSNRILKDLDDRRYKIGYGLVLYVTDKDQNMVIDRYDHDKAYAWRKCDNFPVSESEYAALKAELKTQQPNKMVQLEKALEQVSPNDPMVKDELNDFLAKASKPENEVTRGDEIADLVARIAYFEIEQQKIFADGIRMSPELKKLSEQQLSARNQLATIINQGV